MGALQSQSSDIEDNIDQQPEFTTSSSREEQQEPQPNHKLASLHLFSILPYPSELDQYLEQYQYREKIIDRRNEAGLTPIIQALLYGLWETAMLLVDKYHCNVSLLNPNDQIDVLIAVSSAPDDMEPPEELLDMLVGNGADVNHCGVSGLNCLMIAAFDGKYQLLKYLLSKCKVDPNAHRLSNGATALILALQTNGYINMKKSYGRMNMIIKTLLLFKADPNLSLIDGTTPYMLSMRFAKENQAVITMLLEAGADYNALRDGGESAMHILGASKFISWIDHPLYWVPSDTIKNTNTNNNPQMKHVNNNIVNLISQKNVAKKSDEYTLTAQKPKRRFTLRPNGCVIARYDHINGQGMSAMMMNNNNNNSPGPGPGSDEDMHQKKDPHERKKRMRYLKKNGPFESDYIEWWTKINMGLKHNRRAPDTLSDQCVKWILDQQEIMYKTGKINSQQQPQQLQQPIPPKQTKRPKQPKQPKQDDDDNNDKTITQINYPVDNDGLNPVLYAISTLNCFALLVYRQDPTCNPCDVVDKDGNTIFHRIMYLSSEMDVLQAILHYFNSDRADHLIACKMKNNMGLKPIDIAHEREMRFVLARIKTRF